MRPSLLVVVAIAITGGAIATAGPLTPPAGPPAPTGKTLTEVEPRIPVNAETAPPDQAYDAKFLITEPGSYYLTEDLAGVDGKSTIYIQSFDVTLDLNGFTVQGPRGAATVPSNAAIFVDGGRCVVRNGRAGDSDGVGVLVIGPDVTLDELIIFNGKHGGIDSGAVNTTIRECAIRDNGVFGVNISAGNSRISDSSVFDTFGLGITVRDGTVERCLIADTVGDAAIAASNSTITDCELRLNQFGIVVVGSVVSDCYLNNSRGIRAGTESNLRTGSVIRDNTIINSDPGAGIRAVVEANRIEHNTIIFTADTPSDIGIQTTGAGGGNIVINNSVRGAATAYDLDPADAAGPIIGPADLATTTSPVANIAH
jgi:hypothetical protein